MLLHFVLVLRVVKRLNYLHIRVVKNTTSSVQTIQRLKQPVCEVYENREAQIVSLGPTLEIEKGLSVERLVKFKTMYALLSI